DNTTGGYSGPYGTGLPCTKIQMYVQEFTDAGFTTKTGKCVFPRKLGADCLTNFSDATNTMGDFPAGLGAKVDLTDRSTTIPVDGIRYFQVATKFPDGGADGAGNGADNAYQRRQANLTLRWLLTQ
ncbi:MAG: hypothetical protein JWO68_341, partial [Actinomycetia bacterium]|nr:hypothetical protein [Actinomycetes bacterium]